MTGLNRKLILILFLCLYPGQGYGQQEIDRIVAVIGNEVILLSELREGVVLAARQLDIAAEDTSRVEELKSEILKGMVEEKVILQRAKVEGIEISDEMLNQEVEKDLEKVVSRFPSKEEFEMALSSQGLDLYNYREQLKKEKEKQLIQQKFMQSSRMPYVRISEEEARKFFEDNYQGGTMKPESVELREIVLKIKHADTYLDAAWEKSVEAHQQIQKGESFESVAREISQDEGTKDLGGDLGFVREADILPEIFGAVRDLFPGEVSWPVETPMGIHIFKVVERKVGQIHLSHILFKAEGGGDPFEETMSLARDLVSRIESGEDFDSIAGSYSTDEEIRENRGARGEEALESLPPSYRSVVEVMEEGEVSEPFVVEENIVVVKLEKRTQPRPYRFEEVKDQLIENLGQEKSYQRFVEELEKKTYINIRL
jgi:peptidyl-prolyl cis-trans isomerase SurA